MGQLIKGLEILQADVSGLKQASYIRERSKVEKKGKIKPNDIYPPETERAGRRDWLKAVGEMRSTMVIVERSFSFKERPYDYLLEACGASNVIASFYRLTRQQQIELIAGTIPVLSSVYKQIRMLKSLEDIFDLASMSSSTLYTKLELEGLIESWKLNTETYSTLNESIGNLKVLISDSADGLPPNQLYAEMLKRIKREKLPPFVMRSLDDLTLRIAREENLIVMHEFLLAALKPVVGWRSGKSNQGGSGNIAPQIHKMEEVVKPVPDSAVVPAVDESALFWRTLCNQLTDKSENSKEQKDKNTGNNQKQGTGKNQNQNQNQNGGRGRQNNKKQNGGGGYQNQKSTNQGTYDSSARPKMSHVAPWPKNKPYLRGNQLTPELLAHFSRHCFRCGLGNHRASACRYYDRSAIITLCTQCYSGFHDTCKNPRFTGTGQVADQKALGHSSDAGSIKKLEEKISMLEQQRPNFPFWYPLPPPVPVPAVKKMPAVDSSDDE
jgi:hypothetical protein